MYCYKCGKQIQDDAVFCCFCGAKNDNRLLENNGNNNANVSVADQQTLINNVFNRDVLVNYLYNIRTMEVSLDKLHKIKDNLEYRISNLGIRKVGDGGPSLMGLEDISPALFSAIMITVITLVGGNILKATLGKLFDWEGFFNGLMTVIVVIMAIVAIGSFIYLAVENSKIKTEYESRRQNDIQRTGNEIQQKVQLTQQLNQINEEIVNAENLILDAYSANIIPSKFRNIYGAYFLYDYVSTSTATLNEALLHCDLDTIQQKLDTIISQQEEMIMELAYQNALNRQIVQQNESMLQHAIQTENNTALAAQYTKAAAVNTSVTAYVQMTEFLKP